MLLVTGITGHSGRYFLQELIDRRYKGVIRCIVRETSDTSLLDNSGLNIEKVIGDLNDEQFIEQAIYGIETILHIYNIHHSPQILKAAIKNNVSRAILVHTTGIYSEFKNASQEYKDVEKEVFKLTKNNCTSTRITILRPTMIYGDICDSNMSKFIKMIDKFRVMPIIEKGESLLQPVNARDLGKAYMDVLQNPIETNGKAYNLSGDKPIKIVEVLNIITQQLGKKTIFVNIPIGLSVRLAKLLKFITFGKIDYIEKVQRMGENRSYTHHEAVKDFNYKPISFEKGIQIEIEEYLEGKRSK